MHRQDGRQEIDRRTLFAKAVRPGDPRTALERRRRTARRWPSAGPRAARTMRVAQHYGVRGVAGFDSGSPVLPTMTTEMTAGSVALAFADVL